MISTLASTIELGAHPATALLLGGLAAAVLRGKYAAVVLVLSPLFGLFHVYGMELGAVSNLNLFGYDILSVCLLYTSPSPRDYAASRMPSSA